MNIAVVGYGRMGREVQKAASLRGVKVVAIIDPTDESATHKEISAASLKGADVVIDFTHPGSVLGNIRKVASLKKSLVVGTTGWYERLEEVKKVVNGSGIGFLYSSNFSVGVNAFLKIVENTSMIMNRIPAYDVFGYELHHSQKADSPSGTAKSIAEIIAASIDRKRRITYDRVSRKISPDELHFASIRAGSIPGTHVVAFDSEADTIELRHTARSRAGFALGAVMAAEWLAGRKGFFGMDDFVGGLFGKAVLNGKN